MYDLNKKKTLIIITLSMFILSACGSSAQTQNDIATAVEQTVQAQNSLTKVAEIPTWTPAPTLDLTASPLPDSTTTSTAAPLVSAPGCTVSARLVSEAPPDNVLLRRGENFWKTWSLENTGTCAWDQTYKLVFASGDLMGGLTSYPFPELVRPGETKQVSIYLKAPDVAGTFTGYWSIQTPWNTYLGVGPDNIPFYVKVAVTDASTPRYEIVSVTYEIVREPATGCPTNVRYTVYATITTNGPYEFEYFWDQSDGNESGRRLEALSQAGSITLSRDWLVGKGDSPNPRWMQIIVTDPKPQEYERAVFLNNCP